MQKIHLSIGMLLFPFFLVAQLYTFTGQIVEKDSGKTIPFVQLTVEESGAIFYADIDGCYSFDLKKKSASVQVNHPGFAQEIVAIEAKKHLTIRLDPVQYFKVAGSHSSRAKDAPTLGESSSFPLKLATSDFMRSSTPTATPGAVPPPPPPPPAPHLETYLLSSSREKKTKIASSFEDASYEGSIEEERVADRLSGEASAGETDRPDAGQLTAGEVNDFGKWELWNDVSQEDLAEYRSVWAIYPNHRYSVQLTLANGLPATNVCVELVDKSGKVTWTARTDNHGRAELWRSIFDQQADTQVSLTLRANVAGKTYSFPTAHSIREGINVLELPLTCRDNLAVDIAFVVDATGSMGDEINYLRSELQDVMRRAADSLKGQDLRLGSVFYRDHGDSYLTRHIDFSAGQDSVIEFVGQQSADGGGDTPEAVDDALAMALSRLNWRDDAVTRLLFLVLDAPPHHTPEHAKRMREIALRAAEKGVRIIPVVCSGMDQSGEYLLRSLALATNGTYTFLTDHSGIGNSHLEPSTDSYTVEKLNDLLVRVIHQFGKVSQCTDANPAAFPTKLIATPQASNWSVYPNPTFGPANLTFVKPGGIVFLYDVNGKVLRRFPVITEQQTIELGDLPSGTYFLRHENDGEVSTKRVMVNRA